MSLTVDPEFKSLIPPLSATERADLRAALLSAGRATDPITTWRGVILDGHNRFELCSELGLPYSTNEIVLPDRQAARQWMFNHQIARRNLSPDQVTMLAALTGIDNPRASSIQRKQAADLVAAGGAYTSRVLSGERALVFMYNRLRRARGEVVAKSKPTPKAPPPPPDPVAVRSEAKATAEAKAAAKQALDETARLRAALELRDALAAQPLPPIPRLELASGLREATFVTQLSDVHCEERVRESDTPAGNAYNLKIAEFRLARYFAGVEWLVRFHREAFAIRAGILHLGGDLISGHIHEENVETSAMPPLAAALWIQPLLVDGIKRLVDGLELETLQIICSYGNHGRDTLKPRRATGAQHSYEWGMYQQIAQRFAGDPHVRVHAPPSAHQYAEAYGFRLHFHHGDEIKYSGGVGGITIPVNKAVAQWDRVRRCDYHHFCHFHQRFDGGNWTTNGSVIGFNAYAMSIKASPEPPQQNFYLLDSHRGKTCSSPVWVSETAAEVALHD